MHVQIEVCVHWSIGYVHGLEICVHGLEICASMGQRSVRDLCVHGLEICASMGQRFVCPWVREMCAIG